MRVSGFRISLASFFLLPRTRDSHMEEGQQSLDTVDAAKNLKTLLLKFASREQY